MTSDGNKFNDFLKMLLLHTRYFLLHIYDGKHTILGPALHSGRGSNCSLLRAMYGRISSRCHWNFFLKTPMWRKKEVLNLLEILQNWSRRFSFQFIFFQTFLFIFICP